MVKQSSQRDDDVVLQTPGDYRVVVPVDRTASACAGAAAAFLLRHIAFKAGAYAPGIQEQMFFELTTQASGRSLDAVQGWFGARIGDLHYMGYRVLSRRVSEPTATLISWAKEGRGFRGVVMPTTYSRIHPDAVGLDRDLPHAVAVTVDRLAGATADDIVMVDPWPGLDRKLPERVALAPELEAAHRDHRNHALIIYWSGWS